MSDSKLYDPFQIQVQKKLRFSGTVPKQEKTDYIHIKNAKHIVFANCFLKIFETLDPCAHFKN